jgi:hypothetical protein
VWRDKAIKEFSDFKQLVQYAETEPGGKRYSLGFIGGRGVPSSHCEYGQLSFISSGLILAGFTGAAGVFHRYRDSVMQADSIEAHSADCKAP